MVQRKATLTADVWGKSDGEVDHRPLWRLGSKSESLSYPLLSSCYAPPRAGTPLKLHVPKRPTEPDSPSSQCAKLTARRSPKSAPGENAGSPSASPHED